MEVRGKFCNHIFTFFKNAHCVFLQPLQNCYFFPTRGFGTAAGNKKQWVFHPDPDEICLLPVDNRDEKYIKPSPPDRCCVHQRWKMGD
jgi:hypothetical protein